MPPLSTAPTRLTGCADTIPELGVTRQFDFGQFIELYQAAPTTPAPGQLPTPVRIVLDTAGTLGQEAKSSGGVQQARSPLKAQKTSSDAEAPQQEQQASLARLLESGSAAQVRVLEAQLGNLNTLEENYEISISGKVYRLDIIDEVLPALRAGLVVDALASEVNNTNASPIMLRLTPSFTDVSLSDKQLLAVLAGQDIKVGERSYKPLLDAAAVRVLREGGTVLTSAALKNGKALPVRLAPANQGKPLAGNFEIHDLDGFLAAPVIPNRQGKGLPLNLNPNHVESLINKGSANVLLGSDKVSLTVVRPGEAKSDALDPRLVQGLKGLITIKPPGMDWTTYLNKLKQKDGFFVTPWKEGKRPQWFIADSNNNTSTTNTPSGNNSGNNATTPGFNDLVEPRLPTKTGLPVAVFVPWRQEWTLNGFSRGNLLQSLALAPQEELTLQVFSWERRSRTLEQSSETDTEQSTEFSQSTRDTEDVFREMVSKRDFAWQVSGSIDASYGLGTATINVQARGGVSDTQSIQQTVKNSSQSVKESTLKASSRVRTKRVTRITQTVEQGREERTTRIIRNPNQCHTLTMDFFETLAHYTITLSFQPDRLRLVVLIPNPIQIGDFTSEVVRRNESSLREALLEPALAAGFDACRMVAAYQEAKRLLAEQEAEVVKLDELATQRADPPPGGSNMPSPAEQQAAELGRITEQMIKALKTIRSNANIDVAMSAIASKDPNKVSVTEAARRNGQYWLFINLCAAKFPALLTALEEVASGSGGATYADKAQRLLSVLPKPDAPTNLGNLTQLSDQEKEQSGLAAKIQAQPGYIFWDWGFWTSNLKNESLYTPNDAGLAGLADQLARAYQEWQAKQTQGEAMKSADVAKTEAEGRQGKASTDDKLAMAFPLDELAHAWERQKILLAHFNDHKDHYNYALFQSLPVTEQASRIVAVSDGKLNVGMFEPRVVAMSGRSLAVPLTPLATSDLSTFVAGLRTTLTTAFNSAALTPDTVVLPTPGVSVATRLGACTGCEEYIETARGHELVRLDALARQEKAEAQRREALLDKKILDPFVAPSSGLDVNLNQIPG
ncbi:hypothetical protein [Propionivibrio sp.]|uniref:hypothetical protein n=1 Tax=Propionivibrio sp. TaxID=2212460 RepID=UPI002633FF52|nr:hypothetical protein [Propionivibrio sp.]